MSWRIVQITTPCKLSIKQQQLLYESEEKGSLTIPLEDISVLILDNKQISLNTSLLSALNENGTVCIFSDMAHHPNGVMFPFHNHSRYSEIAWLQVECSEPFKKRIWQEIIKVKINNQAEVLELFNRENASKLREISKLVQSGDSKNSEAFAAGLYWKSLFNNFIRSDDNDIRNSALNYGYAIIRGCLARSVVGTGLLPCFGVHHCNKLNQFNLVDDLIEPLRAFIDYEVNLIDFNKYSELTTELKKQLVNVLTKNCLFNNEEITLLKACENLASSLSQTIQHKDIKLLCLPILKKIPLFE